MTTIHIGSRKSKLAMWQTDTVAAMLEKSGMETQISSMETKGDKILDVSIAKIGSKGGFLPKSLRTSSVTEPPILQYTVPKICNLSFPVDLS